MRLTLLLALASLALQSDARLDVTSLVGRHKRFIRDVRVALRALTRSTAPPIPQPQSFPRRTLGPANGKCVAVSSAQVGFSDGTGGNDDGGTWNFTSSSTYTRGSSTSARPTSSPTSASSTSDAASSSTPGGSSGGTITNSPWKVAQYYSGDSFFDGWNFFTLPDPTNGVVTYVDEGTARSNNLISVNSAGNVIMRVDDTPQIQGNRMSVRITTKYAFTGGLIILDAVHVPTGCSLWPAFWTNGPSWPQTGEIDIMEGVNDVNVNQATIHTRTGCTIPEASVNLTTGRPINGFNCDVAATGNAGCGYQTFDGPNYGPAFNQNNGGVYATVWDDEAISVWFFARGNIPSDITQQKPLPSRWGKPFARWPSTNCDTMSFFQNHSAIFDTTLCGDWAGNTWYSTGYPGQDQSCAVRTGVPTCEQYVRNNGTVFKDAYWEVKSVAIYQPK